MTIKHLGGIFGRNPTFNEVSIDNGIYIGGNTSSNFLDDYEEGTWTPTTDTGTVFGSGRYTKIGNTVFATGVISTFSDRSSTSSVSVGNLPFVTLSFNAAGSAAGRYIAVAASTTMITTTNRINFYTMSSGNYVLLNHNNLTSSSSAIYFQITYQTS